ncbi:MAG: PaaI family thioesterase [Acetobacteraceae bacterium]|nr:PaaI family thioesterase [Acetobacteraceae bacterium]
MDDATMSDLAQAMFQRALGDDRHVFGSFFLSRLLGFDVSYDGESCTVAFQAIPPLFNPQGTLHGGILATAMDVSMGHLLHHVDAAGTTLEMKLQYLAPVQRGRVCCQASFLRRGRSLSFLQSHARNEDGQLIAHATATWKRLRQAGATSA